MAISIAQAINHLLDVSHFGVSGAVAPRIIYYAHMMFMGRTEGDLLVHERFYALATGPSTPTIQSLLSGYGHSPIKHRIKEPLPKLGAETKAIEQTWLAIKDLSPEMIQKEVMREKTAWKRFYRTDRLAPLSDRAIFEEFIELHDA